MWNWYVVDCESSISGCPHCTQLEHHRIDVHHVCSARYWSGVWAQNSMKQSVIIINAFSLAGKACSGLRHIWNLLLPKNWPARRFVCLCRARRACEMLGRFPRRGAIHGDLGACGTEDWKIEVKTIEFINDKIKIHEKKWLNISENDFRICDSRCCFRIPKLRTANLTHLAMMAKLLNLKSHNYMDSTNPPLQTYSAWNQNSWTRDFAINWFWRCPRRSQYSWYIVIKYYRYIVDVLNRYLVVSEFALGGWQNLHGIAGGKKLKAVESQS